MKRKTANPWAAAYPTDPANIPVDRIHARSVAREQWVRVAPTAFRAFDTFDVKLDMQSSKRPPPWLRPPGNPTLTLDYKCLSRDEFFAKGPGMLCTARVLAAMDTLGLGGWTATEIPHASPNPVRGARLYLADIPGRLGAPLSKMKVVNRKHAKNPPFGVGGSPIPPVVIDGSVWTGDSLCFSDWLEVDTIFPYRALLARGDFIQALVEAGGGEERFLLEPVEVANLPNVAPPSRPKGVWSAAVAPWSRPTGWNGPVRDRIVATAERYRHFLPKPPDPDELECVLEGLEQRYQGKISPALREFMAASNGASLFAGMLTFFPIGVRTEENAVPGRFARDDIVGANERVGPDDWLITRDSGWILFASRYAEMHAMWATNSNGLIRLLHQSGEVLGPDLPFDAWLEDQVADLEWAWEHPEAFGHFNQWIDLSSSEGWSF